MFTDIHKIKYRSKRYIVLNVPHGLKCPHWHLSGENKSVISRQSYTLIYEESVPVHVYSMMGAVVPDKKNAFYTET